MHKLIIAKLFLVVVFLITCAFVALGGQAPTRFTDNGDGTIKDNLTKLVWLKNANCIKSNYPLFDNDGIPGDGLVTWYHASDFVAGINTGLHDCGDRSRRSGSQTDWRLPNIREMFSLLDFNFWYPTLSNSTRTGPAVEGDPFLGLVDGKFWTSTTADCCGIGASAWVISFFDIAIFQFRLGTWNSSYPDGYVMVVRGP